MYYTYVNVVNESTSINKKKRFMVFAIKLPILIVIFMPCVYTFKINEQQKLTMFEY